LGSFGLWGWLGRAEGDGEFYFCVDRLAAARGWGKLPGLGGLFGGSGEGLGPALDIDGSDAAVAPNDEYEDDLGVALGALGVWDVRHGVDAREHDLGLGSCRWLLRDGALGGAEGGGDDRGVEGPGGRAPPSARIGHRPYCSCARSSAHRRGLDFVHDFTGRRGGVRRWELPTDR
jgi:hypothetical protein